MIFFLVILRGLFDISLAKNTSQSVHNIFIDTEHTPLGSKVILHKSHIINISFRKGGVSDNYLTRILKHCSVYV